MKDYPYPYPWKALPGTAEEMAFLEERFAKMSIRERYLLEGATQQESIETAADLINLTEQLDSFAFYYGAVDDTALGEYAAKYRENAAYAQMPFLKLAQWGRDLRERHGGVFVSGGFVEQTAPRGQVYTGENLHQMTGGDWCVKLKVISADCPSGVWVSLPDHEIYTQEPDELKVALVELRVTKWDHALLQEAVCRLDNITELAKQYESLEQLIQDGSNLGYVWEEQGQGMVCFEQRFRAAMELEGCTRLDEALDISQNLHCYDFVPSEQHWERFGKDLAFRNGVVKHDSVMGMYFDYAAYCKAEIERLDLQPCAEGYIARNQEEFIREFSKEPQGQDHGMEMK